MTTSRNNWFALLTSSTLAGLLSACSPPPPSVHEKLQITEQGGYVFNGQPVERSAFAATLAAEHAKVPNLFAEITASPKADFSAVTYATNTLKSVGVRFAFADEQLMKAVDHQYTAPADLRSE